MGENSNHYISQIAHEPRLYKACVNVFADAYEYTRKYREFVAEQKARKRTQKS